MDIKVTEIDLRTLQKLEEELWLEETRFDQEYMEKVLATDFFEYGRSGQIHSREKCLANSSGTIEAVIPLKNLNIRLLTADVAQVTYDSEVTYGKTVEKGRRSSIWTRTNVGWELRFHQGTPYEN